MPVSKRFDDDSFATSGGTELAAPPLVPDPPSQGSNAPPRFRRMFPVSRSDLGRLHAI